MIMNIPESIEINTVEYLKLVEENRRLEKTVSNDLLVYSNVISKILGIPFRSFEGKYYIPVDDIVSICKNEFKNLSKNKENK